MVPRAASCRCSTAALQGRAQHQETSAHCAGELTAEELVRVVPVPRRSELLLQQQGWRPVQLSKADRAPEVTLSEDRLSATSAKGFRMVRQLHVVMYRSVCRCRFM